MVACRGYKTFAAWCFFTVAALNLLDMACTSCFILRYGTAIELNPLVVALWNGNPLLFILLKAVVTALFLACGLLWRRLKKWCVVAAVPAAAYACVVGMSLYWLFTLPL